MVAEGVVATWRLGRSAKDTAKRGGRGWVGPREFGCRALQCFGDHLARVEGRSEKCLCDLGNIAFLIERRTFARHSGGGSYANDVPSAKREPASSNQECNVCTLAPPVGVQLIEDEE